MKKTLLFLLFSLFFLVNYAQSMEMKLHGMAFFEGKYHNSGDTTGASDCWGWTGADGEDYAIVGTLLGTHFVRASDMYRCDSVEGPDLNDYYYHRDYKTYRNYLYAVAEMNGVSQGVQIIDLKYLPDSVHVVGSYIDVNNNITSHNLSIDTATATMYVVASNYSGSRIVSLADPENPVDVGFITASSIHDIYARNDTAWIAQGWGGDYSVWDVSNKAAPSQIGYIADPNAGYAHNIWPTDDGKYFLTTEETANKTVKIWNASDMNNITLEGQFLAPSKLAHNVQVMGDSAYVSHYESGVVVYDISNKSFPKPAAHYDTYPQRDGNQFYGCWGVYQYTKNSYIYASSFEGRLHVLKLDTTMVSRSGEIKFKSSFGASAPNPFSGQLNISLEMERSGTVTLDILDLKGQQIVRLVDAQIPPGSHSWNWNGRNVIGAEMPAGMYLLRLNTGDHIEMRKVVKSD